METRHAWYPFRSLVVLALCIIAAGQFRAALTGQAQVQAPARGLELSAPLFVILADDAVSTFKLSPPPGFDEAGAQAAVIEIHYVPAGQKLGIYTCSDWPAEAQNAFRFAANIWQTQLDSSIPTVIKACWTTGLMPGVLGAAGPLLYANFSGAPLTSTWYPAALANRITARDVNGATHEIEALFSASAPWYLGTDGAAGPSQYDFVTVSLHEMAHGLGYATQMKVRDGIGSWGDSTYGHPTIYDRSLENGTAQNLIASFPNNSTQLAGQLTGEDIYFEGPAARAANSGQRPKIYAPATWRTGSSISHLDEIYHNTVNALMTYSLSYGEAIHDPGPITRGLFDDLGWGGSVGPTATPTATRTPTRTPTTTDTLTTTSTLPASLQPQSWLPKLELASYPQTSTPTPTVTRTATSTRTPTTTGTPSSSVQVLPNHAAWTSSIGSLWIMGEVQNDTAHTLRFVKIYVDLLDAGGQPVGNHYGYAKLDNLPSGEKTCFNVLFTSPPAWHSYQIAGVNFWTDGTPVTGLTITSHSGTQKTYYYEITGQIRNDSAGQIRYVEALATLYDTAGKVARCDSGYVSGSHLDPGQTGSFTLNASVYSHLPVASYRLQPDGLP